MTLQFFLPIGESVLVQTPADANEFLETLPRYEGTLIDRSRSGSG